MGQVLVRNVDDELKEQLKERARENGRSLESEIRERLRASIGLSDPQHPNGVRHATRRTASEVADQYHGVAADPDAVSAIAALRRPPLLTDDLDDDVRTYWEARARANGRSLGEEIHALLTEKARWFNATGRGFGSAVIRLFRDDPFERGEIQERPLRGFQYPDFGDGE